MRATTINILDVRPLTIRWRFDFKILLIFGFLLVVSLLSLYIFQVQDVTKTSFVISTYEKKLAEFSGQNKNLEIDFSQVNSPANLETLLKNSQYEMVEKVYYLQIMESQVVTKL